MRNRYLEATFLNGKLMAAYLYLPRQDQDTSTRTEQREAGLIVDFSSAGRPIGIEITSPAATTLSALNRVLTSLKVSPATQEELAPLAVG